MTFVHDPGNKPGHVIDQLWAVISTDADGEGLVAGPLGPFPFVPLVAADEARLKNVLDAAAQFSKATGRAFTLIKLSRRDVVGIIDGNGLRRGG